MERKPAKALFAVGLAVLLVAAILLTFLVVQYAADSRNSIVLPGSPIESSTEAELQTPEIDPFIQISVDNVLYALQSLSKVDSYYQAYTVIVGTDDARTERTVRLWVNGTLIRAEISDGIKTRSVLTNGKTAYIWYEGDASPLQITLSDTTLPEDLLGLPVYDYLAALTQSNLVSADYLVLENGKAQCIYVCSQVENSRVNRFWVDLSTGLLYQADVLENSTQVYSVSQMGFELLAKEDETFANRFTLPDQSRPFIEAEQRLLP